MCRRRGGMQISFCQVAVQTARWYALISSWSLFDLSNFEGFSVQWNSLSQKDNRCSLPPHAPLQRLCQHRSGWASDMGETWEIWVWTISSRAGSWDRVSKTLHKWSSFHCKIKKKTYNSRQLWSLGSSICKWELRKWLQNYSFQYNHFSFACFRHLPYFCRRSLYYVLESSPSNSWAEDLQMLHYPLSTEKWLFLKLPGYNRWPNFSAESISVIQKQEVLWFSACEGNFVHHKVVLRS